jgi:hypothetical protein
MMIFERWYFGATLHNFSYKHTLENVQMKKEKGEFIGCQVSSN